MNELVDTVSKLITESQNAIYGAQRYMVEHEMSDLYWDATDDLYLRFVNFILGRTKVYELELLGIAEHLSIGGYYVCGIFLLFLLFWGIVCCPLLVKTNMALPRLLASKGQKACSQVLGEFLAYLILMTVNMALIILLAAMGMRLTGIAIPELRGGISEILQFFLKLLPVLFMIAAMQFFLYELISGVVSGVLVQFLTALCLGYLSGCFYPITFFPESIQKVAPFLPTGAAMEYAGGCLLSAEQPKALAFLCGYALLFLALAVIIRKYKMIHK